MGRSGSRDAWAVGRFGVGVEGIGVDGVADFGLFCLRSRSQGIGRVVRWWGCFRKGSFKILYIEKFLVFLEEPSFKYC